MPPDTLQKASGIPSRLWRLWGKTPVGRSVRRLDAERNLELVNAESRTTADADQVPRIRVKVASNYLVPRPGLVAAVWTRDREGLNGNSA